MTDTHDGNRVDRRKFLGAAGLGTAAVMASGLRANAETNLLPTIQLGAHRVTRLLAGYNPIGGYSHATPIASRHMREWFTVERTVEFLQHCEAEGLNAFQFDLCEKVKQVLPKLYESGSKLHFVCLHAEGAHGASLKQVMAHHPIAVVHHGGRTDSLFREGKPDKVHDFVKKVHDAGALAGVSTHKPEILKRVADEGWENDLFMACFQKVTRTKEEMEQELGFVTVSEPYIESDRDKMTAVIREVDKPCLAFKILAAGRRCSNQGVVSGAFKYAFDHIKKTDGVIVGMFPIYQDEVSQNARHTRKHGQI